MYQKKRRMVLWIFLFFIFTSCTSTTLFTKKVRDSLADNQLSQVQYYVSESILLSRELNTNEVSEVSSGKVTSRNEIRYEEIIISERTRGELITISRLNFGGIEAECFGICFEASNDDLDKILWFRPGSLKSGLPDGYYLINNGASDGKIKYGDKTYNIKITSGPADSWPYLLFGTIKNSSTRDGSRRKVKGRKIQ
jgi:hypothetical protein